PPSRGDAGFAPPAPRRGVRLLRLPHPGERVAGGPGHNGGPVGGPPLQRDRSPAGRQGDRGGTCGRPEARRLPEGALRGRRPRRSQGGRIGGGLVAGLGLVVGGYALLPGSEPAWLILGVMLLAGGLTWFLQSFRKVPLPPTEPPPPPEPPPEPPRPMLKDVP